jgi:DNA invertase Pin-like site-specific DNA recombinase
MTTVTYLRTALRDDDDHGAIARQRDDCMALCRENGWVAEAEYVDNGTAAAPRGRMVRPAFDQLVRAIEAGEVNRVVARDADRLTRSPSDLTALAELAERYGVEFHTRAGRLI